MAETAIVNDWLCVRDPNNELEGVPVARLVEAVGVGWVAVKAERDALLVDVVVNVWFFESVRDGRDGDTDGDGIDSDKVAADFETVGETAVAEKDAEAVTDVEGPEADTDFDSVTSTDGDGGNGSDGDRVADCVASLVAVPAVLDGEMD